MTTLSLTHRLEGAAHVVELALEGIGARRTAEVQFAFEMTAQDREDVRWYLEDYRQYPIEPAPQIAGRVEQRMAALGTELFKALFEGNRPAMQLWDAAAGSLAGLRVEVSTGLEGATAIPWELLRDPATNEVLSLCARAFVRTHSVAPQLPTLPGELRGALRVLLVICRPGGRADVPFRSVASHLVRLSGGTRDAFQLDVLRPPTFAHMRHVLAAARAAGSPYHVVHFDGHGAYLGEGAIVAAGDSLVANVNSAEFSLLSPPRSRARGFLFFENRGLDGNCQLVDGQALGKVLADADVPVLLLNACRSAHADLATAPETGSTELDAHKRVRAYGSLAQEVFDSGVAGVVAMRYNVYVATAARFVGEIYTGLLEGQELGVAVTLARRQLAASSMQETGGKPPSFQDWMVPVVYEATPLALRAVPAKRRPLLDLSQAGAGMDRASLDPAMPSEPDVGFFGRDETLLALDRAFDVVPVALLHAWSGAGKTSAALEFARWYSLTGAVKSVLFSSFTHHVPLARLLDQVGDRFGLALSQAGVQWASLSESARLDWALRILAQVPVLWVWDNVEPVAGFPAGSPSGWTAGEQEELRGFLEALARHTRCRVLLTSRRDEQSWLGNLPWRITLPAMPMLERLELARAVASRQPGGRERFTEVADWRPLLAFTQGNPLTITVLVGQALHEHRTPRGQVETLIADLRADAAKVADAEGQGRNSPLAVSLDYGFAQAFTEPEREQLALLALFQGFVDVNAFRYMGDSDLVRDPVPTVADLTREAGIRLLDRAAEVGLLTAYSGGHYGVHPAVPWHLQHLFERYYGPPGSGTSMAVVRVWTEAISGLANFRSVELQEGHAEVVRVLGAEEANMLKARELGRSHGWYDLVIKAMQGLNNLYSQTGRAKEWRRLVEDLVPDLTDPATGGPLPGREEQWALLGNYRVRIAMRDRDWTAAEKLQNAVTAWWRELAVNALAASEPFDELQVIDIRGLGASLVQNGRILLEQGRPSCVEPYLEALELSQKIGDHRSESVIAFNLGNAYANLPNLRDLGEAERWNQHSLGLCEEQDTLFRARITGQLGNIAYLRLREALNSRAALEQQAQHATDAVMAYLDVLRQLPRSAAADLAATQLQLGNVYAAIGNTDTALKHYQRAIKYEEHQSNPYGAGRIRLNAARILRDAGRRHDALLYAQAALDDYETVGHGAAAEADRVRRLIADVEQELPDEDDGNLE